MIACFLRKHSCKKKNSLVDYCTVAKSIFQLLEAPSVGEQIKVQGWVKSLRKFKDFTFFDVGDGSSNKKLQILVPHNLSELPAVRIGSSVSVSGNLKTTSKGQLELHAEKIDVIGECNVNDGYPFLPRKSYQPEYIRQYLHFRPQTSKFASLLRVRSQAIGAIHNYFLSKGYVNIHTPIITSNDCEGAGEVFVVHPDNQALLKEMAKENKSIDEAYFDTKAFLTVSGQLHLEAAAHALNKVYTFGPTFRAENSKSRLHLSEFYMLEAELAFVDSLEIIIQVVESLIKDVTEKLLSNFSDDVKNCQENNVNIHWLDSKFPVISYDEAVEILNKNKGKYKQKFQPNEGFGKEHEIFISKYFGDVPTFVINWPKNSKPFYMRECSLDTSKAAAFDLLAPNVGEIVGGSLRENDYNKLLEKIHSEHTNLKWYLDLRKYGGVPTGGFGLGFERYLQVILGIENIKDTIPFPRWPHNCDL